MAACKPVKVLYAISSLSNEGPTRVLLNIARNLERQKYEPSVVTFMPEKENSLLNEFRTLGVPVIQFFDPSRSGLLGVLRRMTALRKLLHKGNFQIAHAHCPRSLFFLVAATPRCVKSIYTVHIYPDTQFRAIHGTFKGPAITIAANLALRLINQPIACADSVAAEYFEKRGYTFRAINNGIEPMDLANCGGRDAVLSGLNLDPDRRYLLYVGRLSAEKRITHFVRTFAVANLPKFDIIVVGSGPEEAALRSISSPRLHIMGFHRDIRPFLAACDYYVSPSATEGLANTLLEAMSVGMPSLLSDIPSHRFFIRKCGGFVAKVFDPLSPESLIAGVTSLQEHDSPNVRAAIRENFRVQFHARIMTRRYEALYREMMA